MSLRTTNVVTARRQAAQLDAVLEDAAMLAETSDLHLSPSQIETMLGAVVQRQLTKLERVALVAKNAPSFNLDQARSDDLRALWTFTLLDAQGHAAVVRPQDRSRMMAEGLSEADIEAVKLHLAMLRQNDLVPTKYHVLRQMCEGVQAVPTAVNMDVAQATYFCGMRLALAHTERRYEGVGIEDEGLVDRLLRAKNDPPKPPVTKVGAAVDRPADPPGIAPTIPQVVPMAEFSAISERVIQQNASDGHWDEKTQRQARSISNLFIKFMVQDQRLHDVSLLSQSHVGKFVDFLRLEIYKHYGKSKKDEGRTIEQLREKGRSVAQSKRGIEGETLNRHLTFLDQIFDHGTARAAIAIQSRRTRIRSRPTLYAPGRQTISLPYRCTGRTRFRRQGGYGSRHGYSEQCAVIEKHSAKVRSK